MQKEFSRASGEVPRRSLFLCRKKRYGKRRRALLPDTWTHKSLTDRARAEEKGKKEGENLRKKRGYAESEHTLEEDEKGGKEMKKGQLPTVETAGLKKPTVLTKRLISLGV